MRIDLTEDNRPEEEEEEEEDDEIFPDDENDGLDDGGHDLYDYDYERDD